MSRAKRIIGWLTALAFGVVVLFAKEKTPVASLSVSGLGWFHNRETRIALGRLWEKPPEKLTTTQIEDAALFILSNLRDQGYQRATIAVEARQADDTTQRFVIDPGFQNPAPAGIRATAVKFKVERGVRSYLSDVKIEGLDVLSQKAARDFFFNEVAVIGSRGARAYSPGRLRRSADAIESTLRQRGYAQAQVKVVATDEDEKTGAVVAKIQVDEGPRWELAGIQFVIDGPETQDLEPIKKRTGGPWSEFRGQDLAEEIRHVYFKQGYPDVRVRIETHPGAPKENVRPINIVARVRPGEQVGVGKVRFVGQEKTKESVLRRRVQIGSGDPLNPVELDKARYRLSRLGIFRSIDLKYEPATGPVRDPVFVLTEDNPREVNLMAGWGSYEKLRGGVEWTQRNLFGRAHQSRLTLIQSMKSSRGDYTYSVPEIFGETIDGSVRLFGLQREERAFVRQEYGGTLMLKHTFDAIHADGTVGYTYQSLRNSENELATSAADNKQFNVASVDLSLTHDGRDNPLRPRRGYRWSAQAELASQQLGSQVNYQRMEFSGSYHTTWGRGRWVHAGLSHGVVTTFGSTDKLLPVNRRFYPGGESSIRGYPEGAAAPRDGSGKYVGAKSYVLADLELEQALTKSWSVVVFTDALGEAASLRNYPLDTTLVSVGLGLRYQTLIGPIRLEYGYNVKKRDADPKGALQVSIGFPF